MFSRWIVILFLLISFSGGWGCASRQTVSQTSATALYNRGIALINKGHYQQAKEIFHEYIASYEDTHLYPVSLYYLGLCYQKLNEAKQAELIYHKVIDQSPEEFWIQMAKKRIQEIEGEGL